MSQISFKTPRQLKEFAECAPTLQEIVYWVAEFQWPSNVAMLITSIFRTVQENHAEGARTEIHCQTPHRAVDVSLRLVPEMVFRRIAAEINRKWDYNHGDYPVAYCHDLGSGLHLHLQVAETTKLRT